jgi:hypothetical protein
MVAALVSRYSQRSRHCPTGPFPKTLDPRNPCQSGGRYWIRAITPTVQAIIPYGIIL